MTQETTHKGTAGTNHLAGEKSPYLLQHANQPVDWFPWGEAAFERARREDKPVLVSIGYSTCHWCHVMAEESFDDPRIADLMNQGFVCIKVDREERPDIDALFISAVSALTGSAGWPLNVFLTPEGKPFFGGTYFPPKGRQGMPGWPEVLEQIRRAWEDPDQRAKIENASVDMTRRLKAHLSDAAPAGGKTIPVELPGKALQAFAADYDAQNGGFSRAPKFPMPPVLDFLITYCRFSQERGAADTLRDEALRMLSGTLNAMARGGIHDHVGGGFHRYATDQSWHVPHFEKMLYDNAQLITVYAKAYELTSEPFYASVVRQTVNYVLRDMRHPEGGFFSAEDADSMPPESETGESEPRRKREGAFYVWRYEEIRHVLEEHPDPGAMAIFSYVYDVRENGNVVQDPFGEFKRQNVLYAARSLDAAAAHFERPAAEIRDVLEKAVQMVFTARLQRFRPHLDDKILTAWNGLMISALARSGRVLGRSEDLSAANQAVDFINRRLYDGASGELYRRWREGEAGIAAMADDYAFLAQGLIDLYEAGFEPWHLQWAIELMGRFTERFVDPSSGAVYLTPEAHDRLLVFTMKDVADNVTPSAASAAARNLVRLSRITGLQDFETTAEHIFRSLADQVTDSPKIAPYLLTAVMIHRARHVHMVISGSDNSADTARMVETGRQKGGLGHSMVRVADTAQRDRLAGLIPEVGAMHVPESGAAAQVCLDRSCRPPVDTPEKLARQLEAADE